MTISVEPLNQSNKAIQISDALNQTLFSVSMIADVLPRIWELNPDEGRARLIELRSLTQGAMADMGRLLQELAPEGDSRPHHPPEEGG